MLPVPLFAYIDTHTIVPLPLPLLPSTQPLSSRFFHSSNSFIYLATPDSLSTLQLPLCSHPSHLPFHTSSLVMLPLLLSILPLPPASCHCTHTHTLPFSLPTATLSLLHLSLHVPHSSPASSTHPITLGPFPPSHLRSPNPSTALHTFPSHLFLHLHPSLLPSSLHPQS